MSTRFFGGGRSGSSGTGNKTGAASAAMRAQLKSGGKVDAGENYKKMLKQKLDEARYNAASGQKNNNFSPFGASGGPKRSEKAEATIKMMAEQAKMKEARKARKAVVVEAKGLMNGKIDAKGRVFDVAGNQVAQVNLKNGSITTIYGQFVGKYQAKSHMTKMALVEVINKNSPHLAHQRKLAEQLKIQQQMAAAAAQSGSIFSNQDTPKTDIFGNEITSTWGSNKDIWGNNVGGNGGYISSFFRGLLGW